MNTKNSHILSLLFLGVVAVMATSLIASCGKTNTVLPAGSNIQLQVVNLSTDLLPVDLYINFSKKNAAPYSYPNSSGYFSLASIDTPFQIRSSATTLASINILSIDSVLKNNVKYTLFITGFKANKTISYIFTKDTSSASTGGRGKVRFVNATAGTGIFNITANGTTVFTNQAYKNVSKFVEMPAGNYDFKLYSANSSTTVLSDLPGVTVQDGKLYTLYCQGIVGRTDTAAFGMAVLNNK
ncbi:MAG: DUF4397 domain-containing protein [Mucilaginibacter sp.]